MNALYFIVGLILISSGCANNTEQFDSQPLAKVGKNILYFDEIKQTLPEYLITSDSATVVDNYIDQWVRNQVMYDEAIRLGLNANPIVKKRIESATRDILLSELRNQIQLNTVSESVTEEDVALFYTTNREMFVLNERHVKVRHLYSLDSESIVTARVQLAAGVSWEEIVSTYAVDKEYSMQTDKKLIAVSQAFSGFPVLKSYLGVIGLNEVSPIAQESGYYHFIQIVEDRPTGDHPELPYVFDRIQEWLKLDRSRRAFKTYEQNLLVQAEANGEIVIYSDDNN